MRARNGILYHAPIMSFLTLRGRRSLASDSESLIAAGLALGRAYVQPCVLSVGRLVAVPSSGSNGGAEGVRTGAG